jgi:flavorubredoxin
MRRRGSIRSRAPTETTMTRVHPIAPDLYRLTTVVPGQPVSFSQFLLDDERPALIHTGTHPMYEGVRAAVAEVLDPARLAYVVAPHFEADECGGMGRFVAEAPGSVLVCSEVGAMINLAGWDYRGQVRGVRDGDTIDLGKRRLRFLETPHVHHWDSMMVFEETDRALYPADLLIQPGEQPPIVTEDLSGAMCGLYRMSGIFAAPGPVLSVVDRIERLAPRWVHPMHGGSLDAASLPPYLRALRSDKFAYDGTLFGRSLKGAW